MIKRQKKDKMQELVMQMVANDAGRFISKNKKLIDSLAD